MNKRLMKPLGVALLTTLICVFSLSAPEPAYDMAVSNEVQKIEKNQKYTSKDLDCLTKNIYFEANTQHIRGKIAVAYVVINRMKDDDYPKSICGVVYQKTRNKNTGKTVAMFSWTRNKRNTEIPFDSLNHTKEIAKCVLNETCPDYSKGATHFHNVSVRPSWSQKLKYVGKIGDHKYYREL